MFASFILISIVQENHIITIYPAADSFLALCLFFFKNVSPRTHKILNLEILRVLAYKYDEFEMFEESINVYEQLISFEPSGWVIQ